MPVENDSWHRPLGHTPKDRLSDATGQTPGMLRLEAISARLTDARRIWMGETHVEGGAASGDHHHGDSETAIYVLRGHPVFVFLDGDVERRIAANPGDYVFVPPFVPHREENPGDETAVVVIARTSQEAIVVNLPSLADPTRHPGHG